MEPLRAAVPAGHRPAAHLIDDECRLPSLAQRSPRAPREPAYGRLLRRCRLPGLRAVIREEKIAARAREARAAEDSPTPSPSRRPHPQGEPPATGEDPEWDDCLARMGDFHRRSRQRQAELFAQWQRERAPAPAPAPPPVTERPSPAPLRVPPVAVTSRLDQGRETRASVRQHGRNREFWPVPPRRRQRPPPPRAPAQSGVAGAAWPPTSRKGTDVRSWPARKPQRSRAWRPPY